MDGSSSSLSSWDYRISFKAGFFYAHPPVLGGPFRSLGEVAAAINYDPIPASTYAQLLREGYSFTLKGGLFHAHPDGVGGPFKFLDDAMDAVWRHSEWKLSMKQILDQDPAMCLAHLNSVIKRFQSAERDTKIPEPMPRSCADDVLGSWKPSSDPAVLEAADRFERIMAKRETVGNGMKWMEKEVLQAFECAGYQGSMYEFVKLDQQCLIYDTFSVSYHHYNFTMKKQLPKKNWKYQLFFAEVKSTKKGKVYFCCPLQPGENGDCFGCENVGVDLKHPAGGNYEKANEQSGFPFDSDSGGDD